MKKALRSALGEYRMRVRRPGWTCRAHCSGVPCCSGVACGEERHTLDHTLRLVLVCWRCPDLS